MRWPVESATAVVYASCSSVRRIWSAGGARRSAPGASSDAASPTRWSNGCRVDGACVDRKSGIALRLRPMERAGVHPPGPASADSRLVGGPSRSGRAERGASPGFRLSRSDPITVATGLARCARRAREWPMRSAICDWVMSSTKRRRGASRSARQVRQRRPMVARPSASSTQRAGSRPVTGRRLSGILAAARLVERERRRLRSPPSPPAHRFARFKPFGDPRPRASAAAPSSARSSLTHLGHPSRRPRDTRTVIPGRGSGENSPRIVGEAKA